MVVGPERVTRSGVGVSGSGSTSSGRRRSYGRAARVTEMRWDGRLNPEEQEAFDYLGKYVELVVHRWGLKDSQRSELLAAIHVLQMYPIQHMLYRAVPDHWSNWWEDHAPQARATEAPPSGLPALQGPQDQRARHGGQAASAQGVDES